MSTSPENELDIELDLHFLPAWARQSPETNRYAKFEGEREDRPGRKPGDRRRERPSRPQQREGRPAGRTEGRFERPQRGQRPPRAEHGRRPEKREPIQPLPEVNVSLLPEENGVESLARQIRLSGRAYPLFEIAHLILQKPERYHVRFEVVKKPEGKVAQPLFRCLLDETLWLAEEDAVKHALNRHFATFYQIERTPADAPKGSYTFVAQCGLSGVILGPPNYHDYPNQLRKLHAERFSRMPFDAYKSKVRIVKDEAVVKQWLEEQSFRTEYVCLNVPEPLRLTSREEVEKHFRQTHMANVIQSVDAHTVSGASAMESVQGALRPLLRRALEEQKRFPIKIATILSQQFASRGLQFFKVDKTVTHVAVARPRFLDINATPVSDSIKRIVEFIDTHPKCTRRQLIEALAPSPAPSAAPAEAAPATETPAAEAEPTPEQRDLIADLHWLIHQGHVIEFANGIMETAKAPKPKPEKPAAKPAEPTAAVPEAAPGAEPAEAPGAEAEATAEEPQAGEPAAPDQTGGASSEETEAK